MCFEPSKHHAIKKWQSPRQEIQKLFKQTFEASIKTFCRKWEGEALTKSLFNFRLLAKYQNKYYHENLN